MMLNKKVYLEAIRIFAILGVIFNHTDGFIYYTTTDNVLTWFYSIVSAIVSRTAVPLFFMVTGALLLDKEESLKELFLKRIMRIVWILLAVSVLYYLFDIVRGKLTEPGLEDLTVKILSGDIRSSFWFLYEYIFVLMMLPFFRKVASRIDVNLMVYLIALRGVTDLLLPLLNEVVCVSVKFDIGFGTGYIYYALLGYFLFHRGEEIIRKLKQRILLIVFIGLIGINIFIQYILFLSAGEYFEWVPDRMVFLTAPIIWAIIKKLVEKLPIQSKLNDYIVILGGHVFGIYLFENFVRWQLLPIYIFLTKKTIGIIACSIYVGLTFLVGFAYTWVLKKIPLIKRYV